MGILLLLSYDLHIQVTSGFPGGASGKEPTYRCRKILWGRAWQPTPVFLPGESHGQRGLAGYSPWGSKESDTTKVT